MCSRDSDEDLGKLRNKDMLNEVCHLSSNSILLFHYLILDFCYSLLPFYVSFLYLLKLLKSRTHVCVDRHSHSLDDVRLFPPTVPLGMTLPSDSSHSYTFGLPDASTNTKNPVDHTFCPVLHYQAKPSFYGRRSTNCLSLDMLGDEQFVEFVL